MQNPAHTDLWRMPYAELVGRCFRNVSAAMSGLVHTYAATILPDTTDESVSPNLLTHSAIGGIVSIMTPNDDDSC